MNTMIYIQKIKDAVSFVEKEYPLVPHTRSSRLFSSVQRMKAEKELGIPINRRAGFVISTKTGNRANEMDEQEWEEFYAGLSNELKTDYPERYAELFPEVKTVAGQSENEESEIVFMPKATPTGFLKKLKVETQEQTERAFDKPTYLRLDGDIYRSSNKDGYGFVEKFDRSTKTFRNVSDTFTGGDSWDATVVHFDELPPDVKSVAGPSEDMERAFDKPTYFELDGALCKVIPNPEGGMTVTLTPGMHIADFMQDGQVITKEEYDKLDAIETEKYRKSNP